ncbi:MAG: hypothetical protein AAFY36_17250, partial [Bacteroidota bacterium]
MTRTVFKGTNEYLSCTEYRSLNQKTIITDLVARGFIMRKPVLYILEEEYTYNLFNYLTLDEQRQFQREVTGEKTFSCAQSNISLKF